MPKSIAGDDKASALEAVCQNSENLAATSCSLGKKDILGSAFLLGIYHITWGRNMEYR